MSLLFVSRMTSCVAVHFAEQAPADVTRCSQPPHDCRLQFWLGDWRFPSALESDTRKRRDEMVTSSDTHVRVREFASPPTEYDDAVSSRLGHAGLASLVLSSVRVGVLVTFL